MRSVSHRSELGGDIRLLLSMGARVTAVEYLHAQRIRRLIRDEWVTLLRAGGEDGEGFDAFLNPTCAGLAGIVRKDAEKTGEVDDDVNGPLSRYSFAANLTGLPAVSVPCGTVTEEGSQLPVGIQLMGPAWGEGRLLSIAAAVEALVDMPRPVVYFEPDLG